MCKPLTLYIKFLGLVSGQAKQGLALTSGLEAVWPDLEKIIIYFGNVLCKWAIIVLLGKFSML